MTTRVACLRTPPRLGLRKYGTRTLGRDVSRGGEVLKRGVAAIVLLLLAAAAWIGYVKSRPLDIHRAAIKSVEVQPDPEGPPGPVFTRAPDPDRGALSQPFSAIAEFIPDPLPHSVWQGFNCEFGGDLIVTLLDGSQVVYGPCRRPLSIDELWAHLLDVYSDGECRPRCGPGGLTGP